MSVDISEAYAAGVLNLDDLIPEPTEAKRDGGDGDAAPGEGGDWPTPVPLAGPCPPPFPVEALSPWQARFVEDLAEFIQTPPDMAARLTLGAAGVCLAPRIEVEAKPGWCEPLNLFVVVALCSGERKSAGFRHVFDPIYGYQAEARKDAAAQIAEQTQRRRIVEGRLADA